MTFRETDGSIAVTEYDACYPTHPKLTVSKKEKINFSASDPIVMHECHLKYIREAAKMKSQPEIVRDQWLPPFP